MTYDKYMTINACENVLRESTNSLLVEVHICTDTVVFSMQVLKKGHKLQIYHSLTYNQAILHFITEILVHLYTLLLLSKCQNYWTTNIG